MSEGPAGEAAEVEGPVAEAPAVAVPAGEEVVSEGPEAGAPAAETAEGELEEVSFDELFTLRPEIVADIPSDEEEEEEVKAGGKKKGKKKGKKHVEIEYDPDADRVLIKKKHKRGSDEIDW
jgi:phosphomannomutase